MQTIRLPEHLPTSHELTHMNQRLRAGEIRLDWHDVTAATPGQLESLFKDLSLPDDYDTLGITTIPEELQSIVATTFDKLERQAIPKTPKLSPPSKRRVLVKPEVWLPEEGNYADTEDSHKTAFRIFSESEEQVVLSATPEPAPTPTPAQLPDETAALEKTISRPAIGVKKVSAPSTRPTAPNRQRSTRPIKQEASSKKILAPLSPAALRDKLETMVITDLLGPAGGEDEEIEDDRVRDRYLVGLLAPKEMAIPPEELDNNGICEDGNEETGVPDLDASQTRSLSPSSIGMSFCVDLNASSIQITTRWGHYQRGNSEFQIKDKGQLKRVWKRTQRGGTPRMLALREGTIDPWEPEPAEQPNVFVRGLVRRSADYWTVTLFLVNAQSMPKQNRDSVCLFQPELSVEEPNGEPIFRRQPGPHFIYREADKPLAMLYRQHVSFAIGHGVSVHAETLAANPMCAIRLSTEIVPRYEVPRTEAPSISELPALASLCLDMRQLAAATPDELPAMLMPLVDAYSSWIEAQTKRIHDPSAELESFEETAQQAMQDCQAARQRIQAGIELLETDPTAAQAFAFMNRAMWLQRIHTSVAAEKRQQGTRKLQDFDQAVNRSWRPFQLAFILLNLPALTDLNHNERSTTPEAIADLLWFPSGGGKTEAYLGLTAYTLAIRRLQGEISGRSGASGVAVIMRYTLRLLTLQQFQRAVALICACEAIRRPASAIWGETPFRLGLWVGQHSTPNTTSQSDEVVKGFQETNSRFYGGRSGNPAQLTHCPWCGSTIDPEKNIMVETYEQGRGRTFIYCGDSAGLCQFTRARSRDEGLPVLVVDEEIYRLLPALLITTVDKFAQLPWRGQTQMLFGQVDSYCERHGFRSSEIKDRDSHTALGSLDKVCSIPHRPLRPPDLIIQDELHLISGPLGTMVGLYETAIDALSTWEVNGQSVRPKVIAATTSIRQADQQIWALFQRQTRIFPPQGLDSEDNFFSRQRQPDATHPGRRYLGICANGRRMKAAQIRVYLAYLAAAQKLSDDYGPSAADPWLTLVGYFNSMSELGGMRHLVDDDISNRIWRMDQRGLASKSARLHVKELTSRVSSSEIPETLSNLEQSFGVPDLNGAKRFKPIDILLANNMISVGDDVQRLSLMVVVGQPKTTAEYIQATSRIGRNYPGLVCTVYNWARPRDLSHYEQFEHYHATFYQQVEALSVTPFAPRALDRGLAALLTSLIRLSSSTFNRNNSAGKVTVEMQEFTQAIETISQRAEQVTDMQETGQSVKEDLQKLITYWTQRASSYPGLGYEEERDDKTVKLLKRPGRGKWLPFTALNSLRNVEPGIQLLLDTRGLGKRFTYDSIQEESEEVGEEE